MKSTDLYLQPCKTISEHDSWSWSNVHLILLFWWIFLMNFLTNFFYKFFYKFFWWSFWWFFWWFFTKNFSKNFWQIFDKFWLLRKFSLTYNLLIIASFRIGVPSILFYQHFFTISGRFKGVGQRSRSNESAKGVDRRRRPKEVTKGGNRRRRSKEATEGGSQSPFERPEKQKLSDVFIWFCTLGKELTKTNILCLHCNTENFPIKFYLILFFEIIC